jgi:hypothetical protein
MNARLIYIFLFISIIIQSCQKAVSNETIFKTCIIPSSKAEMIWSEETTFPLQGPMKITDESLIFGSGTVYNLKSKSFIHFDLDGSVLEIIEDGYITRYSNNTVFKISRFNYKNAENTVLINQNVSNYGLFYDQVFKNKYYFQFDSIKDNGNATKIFELDLSTNNLEIFYDHGDTNIDFVAKFFVWENSNKELNLTLLKTNQKMMKRYFENKNLTTGEFTTSKMFDFFTNLYLDSTNHYFPKVFITSENGPLGTTIFDLSTNAMEYYSDLSLSPINKEYVFFYGYEVVSGFLSNIASGYMNLNTGEKFKLFAPNLSFKGYAQEHDFGLNLSFHNEVLYFKNVEERKILGVDAKTGCTAWIYETESNDFGFGIDKIGNKMYVYDSEKSTLTCLKLL